MRPAGLTVGEVWAIGFCSTLIGFALGVLLGCDLKLLQAFTW